MEQGIVRERERERIKASWVSISRVEASREDSLGLEEGYRLHRHLCILLASPETTCPVFGDFCIHLDAVVNRCRQSTAGTSRKQAREGDVVLFLFSWGHIRMVVVVAPRLFSAEGPFHFSLSLSLRLLMS